LAWHRFFTGESFSLGAVKRCASIKIIGEVITRIIYANQKGEQLLLFLEDKQER